MSYHYPPGYRPRAPRNPVTGMTDREAVRFVRRRILGGVAALGVLAVVVVLLVASWYSKHHTLTGANATTPVQAQTVLPAPASSSVPSTPAPATTPSGTVDQSDPVAAASAFIVNYTQQAWTDPSPSFFLHRVKPLTTAKFFKSLSAHTDGTGGAGWEQFRTAHAHISTRIDDAAIDTHAPPTPTRAAVRVVYYSTTSSSTGTGTPLMGDQTVMMVNSGGVWLADGMLQAN